MKKTLILVAMLASSTGIAYAETSGVYVNGQLG